jgi:hypothetical protein
LGDDVNCAKAPFPPTREELNAGKWTVLGFPTNTLIAAQTWMPSICLPAGFTPDGLPVGMEIVVPPYHEPDLFRLGYAFERATGYRRPPAQRTGAVTEPLQSALRLRAGTGQSAHAGDFAAGFPLGLQFATGRSGANLNVKTAYLDRELCGVDESGLPSFARHGFRA